MVRISVKKGYNFSIFMWFVFRYVRFQVLTAANIEANLRHCAVHSRRNISEVLYVFTTLIALTMEAVSTSETSVSSCETTQRNGPEDSHIYCCIC
jgi:hypothetical protein